MIAIITGGKPLKKMSYPTYADVKVARVASHLKRQKWVPTSSCGLPQQRLSYMSWPIHGDCCC